MIVNRNIFSKTTLEIFLLNTFALASFCAFNAAKVLVLFFCVYALINYKDIRESYEGSKIFYFFLIYTIYISISAFVFSEIFPETRIMQINSIYWWLAPWTFLIIAWLIRGRERVAIQMLQFAFLGFIIRILIKSDWTLYKDWLSGGRYDFGYPWLVTSLYCSIFLTGIFIFREKIKNKRTLVTIYFFLGFPFIMFVMVVTQSRGMFILIALMFLYFILIFVKNILFFPDKNKNIYTVLSILILCCLILLSQFNSIKSRFIEEKSLYEKISKFEIREIPYTSFGARIHLADYSRKLIAQRPFFGWGPGTSSTQYLRKLDSVVLSEKERIDLSPYWHLHNLFLEISVRFGLIGLTLHIIVIAFLAKLFINKKNTATKSIFNYFLVFAILNIYFNLYDFRYINSDYRNYLILFMGIFFSQIVMSDIGKERNVAWEK